MAKIEPRIPPVKNEVRFSFVLLFAAEAARRGLDKSDAFLKLSPSEMVFTLRNFDFEAFSKM